MGADVGTNRWEGDLFADDRHGFSGFAIRNTAYITGGIHASWAAVRAGGLGCPFYAFFGRFNIDAAMRAGAFTGKTTCAFVSRPSQYGTTFAAGYHQPLFGVLDGYGPFEQILESYTHTLE
jgi:hypothetical protein